MVVSKKPKKQKLLKVTIGQDREGFLLADREVYQKNWPYADSSIEEFYSYYDFQRIPGDFRGDFMDNLYHSLISEGKATIVVPYYSAMRSFADYMYAWPPVNEMSFLYFNKKWREDNKVPYKIYCDFDFTYGYLLDPETAGKSQEVQPFQVKHYMNSAVELHVTLTKRNNKVS